MIKNGFFFLFSIFLSSAAMAQSSKMPMPQDTTKGFRISIVKPALEGSAKASFLEENVNFDVPDTTGLSFGYANLPAQRFGWTANATVFEMREQESANMLRLDGNLAYSMNSSVHVKGGINVSQPIDEVDFSPGIGFQTGVGIQMSKNFGLDIGYTSMNSAVQVGIEEMDGSMHKYNIRYNFSGPEIGLTGTF